MEAGWEKDEKSMERGWKEDGKRMEEGGWRMEDGG